MTKEVRALVPEVVAHEVIARPLGLTLWTGPELGAKVVGAHSPRAPTRPSGSFRLGGLLTCQAARARPFSGQGLRWPLPVAL